VQVAAAARRLKGHGLDEGVSTRLIVYAGNLVRQGVALRDACRMAMVRPITDDAEIRETLEHTIDAVLV
jgi:nitric oxide reductase NorQ protein